MIAMLETIYPQIVDSSTILFLIIFGIISLAVLTKKQRDIVYNLPEKESYAAMKEVLNANSKGIEPDLSKYETMLKTDEPEVQSQGKEGYVKTAPKAEGSSPLTDEERDIVYALPQEESYAAMKEIFNARAEGREPDLSRYEEKIIPKEIADDTKEPDNDLPATDAPIMIDDLEKYAGKISETVKNVLGGLPKKYTGDDAGNLMLSDNKSRLEKRYLNEFRKETRYLEKNKIKKAEEHSEKRKQAGELLGIYGESEIINRLKDITEQLDVLYKEKIKKTTPEEEPKTTTPEKPDNKKPGNGKIQETPKRAPIPVGDGCVTPRPILEK